MKLTTFKTIFFCFLILTLLLIFSPQRTEALSHEWIAVPNSQYGDQLWDKKSVKKNMEGSFRVLSKFTPKNKTNITSDILYTMDINCKEKSFKDVAIGAEEFNEFENNNPEWKDPNGDKLILGVIDQVCAFID